MSTRKAAIPRDLRKEMINYSDLDDFDVADGHILVCYTAHRKMLYFGLACCTPEDMDDYSDTLGEHLAVGRLSKLLQTGTSCRYSNVLPFRGNCSDEMRRAALIYHLYANAHAMGPWLRDLDKAGYWEELVSVFPPHSLAIPAPHSDVHVQTARAMTPERKSEMDFELFTLDNVDLNLHKKYKVQIGQTTLLANTDYTLRRGIGHWCLAVDKSLLVGSPKPITLWDVETGKLLWSYPPAKSEGNKPKTILVDFDGVLNSYKSGWLGAAVTIPDPPVPGAIEWLTTICADPRFKVCIYSSRSKERGGIHTMKDWLHDLGVPDQIIDSIDFPIEKPSAFLTIDDRAFRFMGTFPTLEQINEFKPWWR